LGISALENESTTLPRKVRNHLPSDVTYASEQGNPQRIPLFVFQSI